MLDSAKIEKIIDHLWGTEEQRRYSDIYAIIDAGRSDDVFIKLMQSGCEYLNLFRGEKAKELATVSPYLVVLEYDDPFARELISEGWGESWGIFLRSQAKLKELQSHFREFLMVVDEAGTPFYFRYYDPRVLRAYLPTCNGVELATVFGPVQNYFVEEDTELLIFSLSEGKLSKKTIASV